MFATTRLICRRIHGTGDVTVPKLSGFSIVSPKYSENDWSKSRRLRRSREQEVFAATRLIGRRIHGTSDVTVPKLSGFSIVSPKHVAVEYADGTKFKFSSEFLRVNSPAADGKVRSIGGDKVISGRRYVGIMSAEPVGNYGVRLVFDDLHRTGIYPWDYFYELGSNKFGLMRNYIKTLQKHHLSREPPPRRK